MKGNLFKEACLIQLSTSCWQGTKTLHPSVLEARFSGDQSEWLAGRKYLVDPESLSPVKAVVARARAFLDKLALPFPVKGLTLVPKEMLSRIDSGLEEIKKEFRDEVCEFTAHFEDERMEAEKSLGDLFCETDYPIDIESKFRFEWRFLTLDVPGKSSVLPAEVYEREKEKFRAMMQETRELAVSALREEFAGIVHHMLERLSGDTDGKPKRFKASMLEKFNEFLSSFEDRNLFGDESLSGLVEQARGIVSKVSAEKLRENLELRRRIGSEMEKIKEEIDRAIEDLPRRKIRLAA